MENMKFLKEWNNVEGFNGVDEVEKRVTNIFAKWEKSNLIITSGRREKKTSDTYGLPYTSHGIFASLGLHCNVNAVLKNDTDYVAYELALTKEKEVVVYLTDSEENEKYIIIGKL